MQHQSRQSQPTRTAEHWCGCIVEYATDHHGEYPLSVEGCATNGKLAVSVRSGLISTESYLRNVKSHRGMEIS